MLLCLILRLQVGRSFAFTDGFRSVCGRLSLGLRTFVGRFAFGLRTFVV